MYYIKLIFIIVAVILSIVTTKHMVHVHGAKAAGHSKGEVLHDYIFNFLAVLLSWGAFYYLIFFRLGNHLDITDIIIIFISFVGITGYLPHIIINKGFKP